MRVGSGLVLGVVLIVAGFGCSGGDDDEPPPHRAEWLCSRFAECGEDVSDDCVRYNRILLDCLARDAPELHQALVAFDDCRFADCETYWTWDSFANGQSPEPTACQSEWDSFSALVNAEDSVFLDCIAETSPETG